MNAADRVAVLGGADPSDPAQPDDRQRHVFAGVAILVVATWAFIAATLSFHSAMRLAWPAAAVGGALVSLIVLVVDVLLTCVPLRDDTIGQRIKVVLTRGVLSLALGVFISHATLLWVEQSTLLQMVSDTNTVKANAKTQDILDHSSWTKDIAAKKQQLTFDQGQVTAANRSYQAAQTKLGTLRQQWLNDRLCVHGDLARDGDTCGAGDVANALKGTYVQYRDDTLPNLTRTHSTTIARLQAQERTLGAGIASDQLSRQKAIRTAVAPINADTGPIPQSRALLTLLRHDPTAWIYPIFFLAIDLVLALMKAMLPESTYDRDRRLRARLQAKMAAGFADSPQAQQVQQTFNDGEAKVLTAQIEADTTARVQRAQAPAKARPTRSRRPAFVAATLVLALLLGFGGYAIGASHSPTTPAAGAATHPAQPTHPAAATGDVTVRSGHSATLRDGVTFTVPSGSITGNSPVTVDYASNRAYSHHAPLTQAMTFSTAGRVVGHPTLSLHLSPAMAKQAEAHRLAVAYETGTRAGWTVFPSHYDPRTHTLQVRMTHFSTWEFWRWDWTGILGQASQTLGELAGRRAAGADCSNGIPVPSWLQQAGSVNLDDAPDNPIRACVQGHAGDDVLDVEVVNNRHYGMVLTYGGPVKWGWHEDPTTPADAVRDAIGDASAHAVNGLYLPPLSRASVGIFNPGTTEYGGAKSEQFAAYPTIGSLTADVADVVLDPVLESASQAGVSAAAPGWLNAAAAGSCAYNLATFAPQADSSAGPITGLEGNISSCLGDVFQAMLNNPQVLDPDMISSISTLRDGFQTAALAGVIENALGDVLDFYIDNKYASVEDLKFGFAILTQPNHTDTAAPTPTTSAPPPQPSDTPTPQSTQPQTQTPTQSPTPAPTQAPTPTPTTPSPTPTTPSPTPTTPHPTTPATHLVTVYDNYGPATTNGVLMCRGNPDRPESMPGGTVTQTFAIPAGVSTLTNAEVEADADSSVTITATLLVNGQSRATTTAVAAGDTFFNFEPIAVHQGDTAALQLTWSSTYGKLDSVYGAGSPGGTWTVSNSCSDGAPNFSRTDVGLRATVGGTS